VVGVFRWGVWCWYADRFWLSEMVFVSKITGVRQVGDRI
jgi:hypothetical protein